MADSRSRAYELHKAHGNSALADMLRGLGFDLAFKRAQGCSIFDENGVEYLDFLGGYGALNIGHNHPHVINGLQALLSQGLPNILQASLNPFAGELMKMLAGLTGGELQRVFFCNSGAESVEAALKLARIYTRREVIIATQNSFHGKTLGSLSATGREKYRKYFMPLLPGFMHIPYNDLESLEKALCENKVAAFIVEPIQGEGGVHVPDAGYLGKARELCHKHSALFILDEVQTGFCRTGRMFAYQYEGVTPDIMCLAKSLSGGIVPIGAIMTTNKIWKRAYGTSDTALLHTSTFGGNTFAAVAGIKAVEVMSREQLSFAASHRGQYLISALNDLRFEYPEAIKEIRGLGLLIGIEMHPSSGSMGALSALDPEIAQNGTGSIVVKRLFKEHRILTAFTMNNPSVIRLEPPLTISWVQIDKFINAFRNVLETYDESLERVLTRGS